MCNTSSFLSVKPFILACEWATNSVELLREEHSEKFTVDSVYGIERKSQFFPKLYQKAIFEDFCKREKKKKWYNKQKGTGLHAAYKKKTVSGPF